MDASGEERIAAPRDRVWAGLNDTDILKSCIPGCESLEWDTDRELTAVIRIKIGPLSSRFHGRIVLSNIDAPKHYRISAAGKGGLAGFAEGHADVELIEDGGDTLLRYTAGADLGGGLAKMGAKVIGPASQRLAARFFSDFSDTVRARQTQV